MNAKFNTMNERNANTTNATNIVNLLQTSFVDLNPYL